MFDPKDFPFNAEKMAEFFKNNDFTKGFSDKIPGNAEEVVASQKKNMDALVEANKAAAASYQELFKKQLEVFEKTMEQAKKQIDSKEAPSADVAKSAFESALKNMSDMANGAQKANTEALEIVGKRVQDSLQEIKDLGENSK